jgi:hypothetical protein
MDGKAGGVKGTLFQDEAPDNNGRRVVDPSPLQDKSEQPSPGPRQCRQMRQRTVILECFLKSLLAGEIVPISEMVHDTEPKEASVDDEGNNNILNHFQITINVPFPSHINPTVRCHVGDWVEVVHDYKESS